MTDPKVEIPELYPFPWKSDNGDEYPNIILDANGKVVCNFSSCDEDAKKFRLHACNAYPKLVADRERLIEFVESIGRCACNNPDPDCQTCFAKRADTLLKEIEP